MARSDKTLHLDRANGKFLGVCAGIADYLQVEPWGVRLVFIGCVIFGAWFLVPLYFVVWFLLDDSSVTMRESLADNYTVKHFRTVDYRKKIYRNTRDGKILGVCAGIADYLEVNVFAVRVAFVVLTFLSGFPLLFYFAAGLVLDKRPEHEYETLASRVTPADHPARSTGEARPEAAGGFAANARPGARRDQFSKRREFQFCARKFATLQTRLSRLEAYVTSSRYRLHREFKNIS